MDVTILTANKSYASKNRVSLRCFLPVTMHTGEETNTSDYDCSDVIPTKRSLVNLRKGKPPPFIWICDVSVVVVEVVEGSIAARSPVPC